MAAPITFDFQAWQAAFPEFVGITKPMADIYFLIASGICKNDASNPADGLTPTLLPTLLNLLTAHVASLMSPKDSNGNPAAAGSSDSLVGRINTASEGSVSVGAEWSGSGSPSEAWFIQTKYGALYWQMTAQFRLGWYAPNPTYVPNAPFPMRLYGPRSRYW